MEKINEMWIGQIRIHCARIGKDGWIKVVLRERNQLAWINTNATLMIAPYPAVEMNAPAAAPWQ